MKHPLHFGACVLGVVMLGICALATASDNRFASRAVSESMQLNNIGLIYMQRGDTAKAEMCFKQALARQPDLAIAHLNLGLLYQNTGNFGESQWQYHLAMSADPMEEIHQPVESIPEPLDMRTVGEIAFHKMAELPQVFFEQLG